MADLIFNRPSDNYVFTGSRLRAGTTSTKLNLTSKGSEAVIDLCNNSNIDISASTVFVNGQIISEGGIQVGSGIFGGRITKSTNPYEIIIDPFGIDGVASTTQDASGSVVIMGDLVVRGNTTTVYSTNVDISDVVLTLALGSTATLGSNGAGIQLGSGYASLLYDSANKRWKSNIGLDISGDFVVSSAVTNNSVINANVGIELSGNILPINNNSQLPVSYNTLALKTTNLTAAISDICKNEWVDAPGYVISKVVISTYSFVKIEFKVNYTASPEADQTLSFRVLKSRNGTTYSATPVFSDISLGSNMGVTFNNVYYGTFIDSIAGESLTDSTVTYKLQFRRDCPPNDEISTPFGIQVSSGNYVCLQELYRRDATI